MARCLTPDAWAYDSIRNTCRTGTCDKPARPSVFDSYESCAETCIIDYLYNMTVYVDEDIVVELIEID